MGALSSGGLPASIPLVVFSVSIGHLRIVVVQGKLTAPSFRDGKPNGFPSSQVTISDVGIDQSQLSQNESEDFC